MLLSGCSEKQEANDTLPSTSAAETTEALPEVGPADFPVPDEARTKDAAGAEAFLRYYIDLLNRQRASSSTANPSATSARTARSACGSPSNYDEAAAAGQRYEAAKSRSMTWPNRTSSGDEAIINFGAKQEAVRSSTSAGDHRRCSGPDAAEPDLRDRA